MENRDILALVCSHLDNSALKKLSHTSLWRIIKQFIGTEYFWYLRTQRLLARKLQPRSESGWKEAYYYYLTLHSPRSSSVARMHPPLTPLVVLIQLELGMIDNRYIHYAASRGHIPLVKLLMADPRIDPASNHNTCIIQACRHGHLEVVRLLLTDSRVNPSSGLRQAVIKGHVEIVRLLLSYKRINTLMVGVLFREYSKASYTVELTTLLLEDGRVDPTEDDNWIIKSASENGHVAVVRLLLRDKRVDPTAENDASLLAAVEEEHLEVVRLLLEESRVGTRQSIDVCIQAAYYRGYVDILDLLLLKRGGSDPRAIRLRNLKLLGLVILTLVMYVLYLL